MSKPAPAAIIGRTPCPLGDNPAAHVRQTVGKLPYVYCPVCGFTAATRSGHQSALLAGITRPDKLAELGSSAAGQAPARKPDDSAATAPAPEPTKPAKRASAWAPLLEAMR